MKKINKIVLSIHVFRKIIFSEVKMINILRPHIYVGISFSQIVCEINV